MKIKITDIIIGERQRIDLGDLSDLETLNDPLVGLICPIIVHRTSAGLELVDGRRRLAKATALGWTEIEAFEKNTLSPVQKQVCEFFADVGRKDRTWQEVAISTYHICNLIESERMKEGKNTSMRVLEALTNLSDTYIAFRAVVARALLKVPKDEEIWTADNLRSAYKLLLERENRLAGDEIQRRREKAAQLLVPKTEEAGSDIEEESAPLGDAFTESKTEEEAPSKEVHGFLGRAIESNLPPHSFPLVLGFNLDSSDIEAAILFPEKFGILFVSKSNTVDLRRTLAPSGIFTTPFDLIWRHLQPKNTVWPFFESYYSGLVLSPQEPASLFSTPKAGDLMSFIEKENELPGLLVNTLLLLCTVEGQSVLCLGGVNPAHVAECGRIPVFFGNTQEELDKKKAAVLAAMTTEEI